MGAGGGCIREVATRPPAQFGAVDGVHMVVLMKLLGPDYAVWDKGTTIQNEGPTRNKNEEMNNDRN